MSQLGHYQLGYIETLSHWNQTDKQTISCYLDHLLSEWHLCIVDYEIDVELAHPTDIFWNTNAIFEKIEDEELSIQIAYAVNTVYKERNYSEDVL